MPPVASSPTQLPDLRMERNLNEEFASYIDFFFVLLSTLSGKEVWMQTHRIWEFAMVTGPDKSRLVSVGHSARSEVSTCGGVRMHVNVCG